MVFLPVDNYKSIMLYVFKNDNSHGVFVKQMFSERYKIFRAKY